MAENQPSLVALNQIQSQSAPAQPPKQPLYINVFGKAPEDAEREPMRGDEIIQAVEKSTSIEEAEKFEAQLFNDSQETIAKIADQFPEVYDSEIRPQLEMLSGYDFAKGVIDKADEFKIGMLKSEYPALFSSPAAALQAFGNAASFQQLTRMQAGTMAAMGKPTQSGEPSSFDQHLYEAAEWARLLQKAHPGADFIGTVGGYLMPEVRKPFELLARAGGAGAKKLLEKIVTNPTLLKSAQGAAGVGLGSAGIAGAEGYLGEGREKPFSWDRAVEKGASAGMAGAAFGGAGPYLLKYLPAETVGGLIGGGIAGMVGGAPAVPKGMALGAGTALGLNVASKANRYLPQVLSQLSGARLDSLRRYNKMGDGLIEHFGKKEDYAKEFFTFINSDPVKRLPERAAADRLLPVLPSVDATKLLGFLEKKIPNPTKEQAAVMAELADRARWVRGQIKLHNAKPNKVPAEAMREITDQLQNTASSYYGKVNEAIPEWAPALKEAAYIGRRDLYETAKALGGKNGTRYVRLMNKAAEKMEALTIITDKFGSDTRYWPDKIKNYSEQMFGKNGNAKLARMEQLDKVFKTDFAEKLQNAYHADHLGPNGPQPLTQVATGAFAKGAAVGSTVMGGISAAAGGAIGGAVAGAPGAVLGAKIAGGIGSGVGLMAGSAASSPKIAAFAIGSSDKIQGVLDYVLGQPAVLQRMMKNKAMPGEVRRMAQSISHSLTNDGPISAGSTMRVLADTPLFIGFVHHLDLEARRMSEQGLAATTGEVPQTEMARKPQSLQDLQRRPVGQAKFY